MRWSRGRLAVKAHRLVHHSTLGSRVIKKKKVESCVSLQLTSTLAYVQAHPVE